MENPLRNLIEIIKTGSREEVKVAQKQIEKYWNEIYIPKRKEGKETFLIFLDEIEKFNEIEDIDHQAYFINTLKWPLWAIGEEYFEKWAEFILKHIQNPSGKIRQAVIRASDYLILDIRTDLKYDFENKISETDKKTVEKNIDRFGRLVYVVEYLLRKYGEPRFYKYKYVSGMPISIYKSLQKLITECLLRSDYYKKIYKKWLEGRNLKRNFGESEKNIGNSDIFSDYVNYCNQFSEKELENKRDEFIAERKNFL